MFGAVLIPPTAVDNCWGVAFMDAMGYPDMCGHATIGTVTTLVETGLVKPLTPEKDSTFDFKLHSPAGLIELEATMKGGRCYSIGFRTSLAYFVGSCQIDLRNGNIAQVNVAYGGQYYGFIDVSSVDLAIEPDHIDALIEAAIPVRAAVAETFNTIDKRIGSVPAVGNIVWTSSPKSHSADARNVPISQTGSFDRSPCGTATCARMATLTATGDLKVGQSFVNESILGTQYYGRVVGENSLVKNGIVPQVVGRAWLIAHSRLLLDDRDPLGLGYLIGGGTAVL